MVPRPPIVLLIIGLPIVLATAFVQEGGPEPGFGEAAELDEIFSQQQEGRRGESRGAHRLFTWRKAILGGVGAFALWGVLAAGWVLFGGGRLPAGLSEGATTSDPSDAARQSVAVLPFENMSADPDNEYFSDGITEEILNALTQVQGLRVPGRTSSFSFKGTDLRISQIGPVGPGLPGHRRGHRGRHGARRQPDPRALVESGLRGSS